MQPKVSIYEGKSSKSGKPFTSLKIEIGYYSVLVFPTPIEMMYIKQKLAGKAPAPTPEEDAYDQLEDLVNG